MYVYCRGTDDFQIVRRQFFKVVCEGATESREDHQHEGVGVSYVLLLLNIFPDNVWLLLPHMQHPAARMKEESIKKGNFLCRLDSLMLGYQAEMFFMIR